MTGLQLTVAIGLGLLAWVGLGLCLATAIGLTIRAADRAKAEQVHAERLARTEAATPPATRLDVFL